MEGRFSIGFDFGTESVRVLLVRVADGAVAAQSVRNYEHAVIDETLPASGARLPADYALQDPRDWMNAAQAACKEALKIAGAEPEKIVVFLGEDCAFLVVELGANDGVGQGWMLGDVLLDGLAERVIREGVGENRRHRRGFHKLHDASLSCRWHAALFDRAV